MKFQISELKLSALRNENDQLLAIFTTILIKAKGKRMKE